MLTGLARAQPSDGESGGDRGSKPHKHKAGGAVWLWGELFRVQTCPPSIPGSARSPPCSPLLPRGLSPRRLDVAASETCRLLPAVSRTAAKGNLRWEGGTQGSGSPGAEPHPERLLPAPAVMGAGALAVAQMAVRGGGGEAACGGSLAGAAQTREPGVRSRRVCSDTCSVSLQRKEQRRGCALSGEAALGGLPEERMLLNEALPRCPRHRCRPRDGMTRLYGVKQGMEGVLLSTGQMLPFGSFPGMLALLKISEKGSESEEMPCRWGMACRGRGSRAMLANAPLAEKLRGVMLREGSRKQKARGVCAPGVTAAAAARGERGQPCFGAPNSVGEQEGTACDTDRADHSREGTNESWTSSRAASVVSLVLCVAAAEPTGAEKTSHTHKKNPTTKPKPAWSQCVQPGSCLPTSALRRDVPQGLGLVPEVVPRKGGGVR